MSIAEDDPVLEPQPRPAVTHDGSQAHNVPEKGQDSPAALWPPGKSPLYPDVASWVDRWLCPHLEREITRTVEWCPMWWDHPEARERLEALWEAWEIGRMGGGPWKSAWWAVHADRHLIRLCHPDTGPFGHCHSKHRRDTKAWRSEPLPADWAFSRSVARSTVASNLSLTEERARG